MAVSAVTYNDVIQVIRKVIGQRDSSAPDASDTILLNYIIDFVQFYLPNDFKIQDNWTTYPFVTEAGTFEYLVPTTLNYAIYRPPCYSSLASGDPNSYKMRWYQSMEQFYSVWGYVTDTAYLDSGQPTDILFYDNKFTLRPVPDNVYTITMRAYKIDDIPVQNADIPANYLKRYIAYGAARDYLRDFMDTETLAKIEGPYQEYRELVLGRTATQNLSKTSSPRF
jgi:hypothetical protein